MSALDHWHIPPHRICQKDMDWCSGVIAIFVVEDILWWFYATSAIHLPKHYEIKVSKCRFGPEQKSPKQEKNSFARHLTFILGVSIGLEVGKALPNKLRRNFLGSKSTLIRCWHDYLIIELDDREWAVVFQCLQVNTTSICTGVNTPRDPQMQTHKQDKLQLPGNSLSLS